MSGCESGMKMITNNVKHRGKKNIWTYEMPTKSAYYDLTELEIPADSKGF
jgi:hypothetical protein